MNPFDKKPLYVMVKPAGSTCNLACSYCYYLDKRRFYAPGDSKAYMSDEMLELYIKRYFEAQTADDVNFTWHGGEAMLRPLSFYKKAMELQARYSGGRRVLNCLQTNGTMLTEELCRFLRDNGWLVGISIDGPQEFHDEYRRSRDGKPSFLKVMSGIRMLNAHGVEWNAMAVINDYNADHPEEFYNFFKSIGCRYIQFTPIVERLTGNDDIASPIERGSLADFSVSPEQWGEFLCRLFALGIKEDVGRVFVQIFDSTLANWCGVPPGVCSLDKECGHAAVMEYNGNVYCCDHFVFPEYYLGNLRDLTFIEMMTSAKQLAFGAAKRNTLSARCRQCKWLFACNGECPKNRIARTAANEPINYLCEGYRRFFAHVAPYMDFMRDKIKAGEAPADVMTEFRK
ncbi:MAG: anaerobic sulfatase-maturation protein [Muribaculaceae bacterium]|nr:anaerobic sulfatase-maturation protein [Muribaculaceae bacterium]